MNRKLLFTTLLCINAHNYGAQEYAHGQNAQPPLTLAGFLSSQERLLGSLNNPPVIPTNPELANQIRQSEKASQEVQLRSFMVPTLALVIPVALFKEDKLIPSILGSVDISS